MKSKFPISNFQFPVLPLIAGINAACLLMAPSGSLAQDAPAWTKYDNTIPLPSDATTSNGRIPEGLPDKGDDLYVYDPMVIKDGAVYKMWYVGYDGAKYRIYHATSTNGLDWTKYDNTIPTNSNTTSDNGRIPFGSGAFGDTNIVWTGSVIKDGSTYKMWYTGHDGVNYRGYYATSTNGLDWTKYDNTAPTNSDTTSSNGRIPLGTPGKGDSSLAIARCVIKDGADYKMWYVGSDGFNYRIYYATSSNGLDWTKYDNTIPTNSNGGSDDGRIPLGGSGRGDNTHTRGAWVIKDGATYKMWYTGYDGANYRIYYATSSDGLIWNKYDNFVPANADANSTSSNGRVPLAKAARGDAGSANPGAVLKEDSTYKMWYTGYDGATYRIYYATSSNGLVWTKYNTDIPSPTNSGSISSNGCIPLGLNTRGDDYYVSAPSVLKDGTTYKMWYSGYDGAIYRIYYATSSNGLDWTKYDNTIPTNSDTTSDNGRIPLGTNGPAGDDAGVVLCCVIKDGAVYKMWYTGSDGSNWRIYYATSSNGLDWTKYDNSIPAASDTTSSNGRIPLGLTAGRGDVNGAYGPWVIKDGATYKMWYGGSDGANWRFYYATSSNGLDWAKYDNTIPANSDGTSSNGRLPLGTAGRGDNPQIYRPFVIKDGQTYKMWYQATGGGTNRTYYATFYDGDKATAVLID